MRVKHFHVTHALTHNATQALRLWGGISDDLGGKLAARSLPRHNAFITLVPRQSTPRQPLRLRHRVSANEIRIALSGRDAERRDADRTGRSVGSYLQEKFTNTECYEWMESQMSNLHSAAAAPLRVQDRPLRLAEHGKRSICRWIHGSSVAFQRSAVPAAAGRSTISQAGI